MKRGMVLAGVALLLAGCAGESTTSSPGKATSPAAEKSKATDRLGDLMADASRDSLVRQNMENLQGALKHYAIEHLSLYPQKIDEKLLRYLERVAPGQASAEGLFNPYSGKREWPEAGNVTDPLATRLAPPPAVAPGRIEYSLLKNSTGYAIIGGGRDGKALRDDLDTTLVYTPVKSEE